ncbi:regulator [Duganella sp. FT27W]|uniref:regulator n=1 Tax=Duganella sp. FT27W TaxID=2654636 RepID=UPI00128AFCC8|nr:regulator [Duganella sp. FT27W]
MAAKKAAMKVAEKTVKIEPGKNRIRLLPGWRVGEEHVWFHDFGQHFIKDASDKIQAVYMCASATHDRDCDVCKALTQAGVAAADDATSEVLAKAKASRTVLINALMLDSKEPNTPVILEIKRGVFGQLVDIIEENGALVFAENGNEIIINREGKGLNTSYTAQISLKTYTVPPAALAKLNNLDEYVKQESAEQERRAIAAVNTVAGMLPAPGAGGDRPETTASRLAAPSKSNDLSDVMDLDETPPATPAAEVEDDADLTALLADLG